MSTPAPDPDPEVGRGTLPPQTQRSARRLARSAGLIGIATMTSRVLGLVRDQVLAYLFGAGNAVDAYNVAFRIPNLVRDLFAEGAMSAAFVPTFTRYLTREGKPAAWRLGSNVVNALLVMTTLLVLAGLVYTRPLVTLFAEDYSAVPGKLELTVLLTRIMLPFLTLVAIAAAFMGMLNSLDRFFVPALSPAMFNVGSIACALILVPVMPSFGLPPIAAMGIGVLIGGLGQTLVQWPILRGEGYRYAPVLDLREPGLRQVLVLMGPGTLGLAATQINVFVNTVLATGEGTGAVSWLNYAFRLMYLPLGLFGVSIATAAMPGISRYAAQGDMRGMRHEVANGIAMMMAMNVPATLGLMVLAHSIVAMLFERGAFRASDTDATAAALMCYAVGLTGYSIVKVVSPTFYALHESRTPVIVSAASVLVNAALNIAFVRRFGYLGLAVGTSLTALLNAGVLLIWLSRRLGGIEGRRLAGVFARSATAALVMAGVAFGLDLWLPHLLPGRGLVVRAARVGLTIGTAVVVMAAVAWAVGLHEIADVVRAIAARFQRGRRG
jgi:putative peptidoglycan lipid II flippase